MAQRKQAAVSIQLWNFYLYTDILLRPSLIKLESDLNANSAQQRPTSSTRQVFCSTLAISQQSSEAVWGNCVDWPYSCGFAALASCAYQWKFKPPEILGQGQSDRLAARYAQAVAIQNSSRIWPPHLRRQISRQRMIIFKTYWEIAVSKGPNASDFKRQLAGACFHNNYEEWCAVRNSLKTQPTSSPLPKLASWLPPTAPKKWVHTPHHSHHGQQDCKHRTRHSTHHGPIPKSAFQADAAWKKGLHPHLIYAFVAGLVLQAGHPACADLLCNGRSLAFASKTSREGHASTFEFEVWVCLSVK